MKRIIIEIDADEKSCIGCHFLKINYGATSLCVAHESKPLVMSGGYYFRLPECLAAEERAKALTKD